MFKKTLISLAVASSVGLTGCLEGGNTGANANPDYNISQSDAQAEFLAQFEGKVWPVFDPFPAVSDLPVPNDLIFGSVGDGTFEVADTSPPVTTALNNLSGASTVAPIDIKMSGRIEATSLKGPDLQAIAALLKGSTDPQLVQRVLAQNVFLVELEYASGAPLQALQASEKPTAAPFLDFEVKVKELNDSRLGPTDFIRIIPTKPLNPNKRYVAVVLNNILDADGEQITNSPAYANIKDETEVLGASALKSVRTLINSLWEPIATNVVTGFQKTFNPAAPGVGTDDIALTYSFTTSNDEQVLKYMANPAFWAGDQVLAAAKLRVTKKVTGAALFFANQQDPENNVAPGSAFDLNDDDAVTVADFDRDSDGAITPADFILADRDGDSTITPADFQAALAPNSQQPFGFVDLQEAVDQAEISAVLGNPALASCDSEPYQIPVPDVGMVPVESQSFCVGTLIKGSLAQSGINLPSPSSAGEDGIVADFTTAESAPQLSALLGSITGSDNVNVVQGSITLPYYLGLPTGSLSADKDILTGSFWKADSTLAVQLNGFLKAAGLDLVLPQGKDGEESSDIVNWIFPFPEKKGDVSVPMLVMYPKALDSNSDGTPDLPFDPTSATPPQIPVVIYQHGITTDRTAALTFGSALAAQGVAVVAIDQPFHGVSPIPLTTDDPDAGPLDSITSTAGVILTAIESQNSLPEGTLVPGLVAPLVESALASDNTAFVTAVNGSALPANLKTALTAQAPLLVDTVGNAGSQIAGIAPRFKGQGLNPEGATERHFGYGTNALGQVIPMNFDPTNAQGASGDLFINLQNFMNGRDILRQGAVDLMTVRASIQDIAPAFDATNVYFVGHSLGTLNGGAFVAAANSSVTPLTPSLELKGANLLTPVAGTVRMLENSPSFGPEILGGLKAKSGLTQDDANLQTFLNVLQATIDTVDPINHAELLDNVLFSQINDDSVVINNGRNTLVEDTSFETPGGSIPLSLNGSLAPLSGSEPLAALAEANALNSSNTAADPVELPAFVKFWNKGVHSTPVLPADDDETAVFTQMVVQTLSIIATDGDVASVMSTDAVDPAEDSLRSVVDQ